MYQQSIKKGGYVVLRFKFFLLIFLMIHLHYLYAAEQGVGAYTMDFLKLTNSVHADSMGNAMTSIQSLSGMTLNPASIAEASKIEVKAQYQNYLESISHKNVMAVFPTPFLNVGLELGQIDLGSQLRTTFLDKSGSLGEYFSNDSNQFRVVLAKKLSNINFGLGASYVTQRLDSYKSYVFLMQMGMQMMVFKTLRLGFSTNNLTLQKSRLIQESESVAQEYRLGISGPMPYLKGLSYGFDLAQAEDTPFYPSLGLEYSFNDYLKIRGGYNGQSQQSSFSGGIAVDLMSTMVEFSYKNIRDFGQTFRVGVGYRF